MTLFRMLLLLAVSTIFALGLIMIFSTSSAEILDHELNKSMHQALVKQICYALAGLGLAAILMKVGYKGLLRFSTPLMAIFSFLLLLVLIPGIGHEVNGSRRWLNLAGFSFQPSEIIKYLAPAYFIHHYLQYDAGAFAFRDFMKLMAIEAIPIFLILIEPNNGTALVVVITLLVLFFLMRISIRYWALPLAVGALIGGAFASQLPYVTARLNVYLHPELDLKGKGHQPYQSKIAAGSGGVFGRGPGNSLQKLSYLPEAQNDYIAAIYAEEFGFLGILALISLYLLFASLGFYMASYCQNPRGFYLASSVVFLISFQAFLNLGVVSGLLPSTGLNLPFFSQGGSSLIANIAGLALLFSVSYDLDFVQSGKKGVLHV